MSGGITGTGKPGLTVMARGVSRGKISRWNCASRRARAVGLTSRQSRSRMPASASPARQTREGPLLPAQEGADPDADGFQPGLLSSSPSSFSAPTFTM